jgi:hypothetical protein
MCRTLRLDENYGRRLIMVCVLLDLCSCSIASLASPSPGSSTPERCHPEDVLLSVRSSPSRRKAGRAAQVDKLVLGVAQGARYEARLRLVKLGFTVHEEWLHFHGAVEQDDQAQRIPFAVPPCLPAAIRSTLTSMMRAASLHRSPRAPRTINGSAFSLK